MTKLYARLIQSGRLALGEVPPLWREAVRAALEEA